MESDCEWHEMKDYIVARAYILKHTLDKIELQKQIDKLIKKANQYEIEEIEIIIEK
jgi:hypothetical protein